MAERQAGTGQLKKLLYTRYTSDKYGVVWKLSTYKVLLWLIVAIFGLILLYSFFISDQADFLKNILFYSIVILIIVAVLWVVARVAWKTRKTIGGFFIAFILIIVVYFVLDLIFGFVGLFNFHYGLSTWLVVGITAGLGSSRIDGNLTKDDVFYAVLVLLIIWGGNLPVFENGGFFQTVDEFGAFVLSKLPWVASFFS